MDATATIATSISPVAKQAVVAIGVVVDMPTRDTALASASLVCADLPIVVTARPGSSNTCRAVPSTECNALII